MDRLIFLLITSLFLIAASPSLAAGEQDDDGIRGKRELSRPSSSFPDLQFSKLKDDLLKVKKSFAEFQAQITSDLSIIKKSLFLTHNANILDKRLDNCVQSLSNGNQMGGRKFWDALRTQLLPLEEANELASRILNKLDLTNGTIIKTILSFLTHIEYPQGFHKLLDTMRAHNLVYNRSEIFILAVNYRNVCDVSLSSRGIFHSLPYIVQEVTSSAVQIKNVLNRGYLHGNGSGPAHVVTSRSSRTAGTNNLWVFRLNSNNNNNGFFTIANKYKNNTQLVDDETEFGLKLVTDDTFRIQIVKSPNHPEIVGKFLAGKVKKDATNDNNHNNESEFSPVEFMDENENPEKSIIDATKWTVEDSLSLENHEKVYQKNC